MKKYEVRNKKSVFGIEEIYPGNATNKQHKVVPYNFKLNTEQLG